MRRGSFLLIGAGAMASALSLAGFFILSRPFAPVTLVSLATAKPADSADHTVTVIAVSSATASSLASNAPSARSQSRAGPVASITIPRIGIHNAPIYDRGIDRRGNMLIAPGYAVTHYNLSAPLGQGNAVIYGHDDIQGSIFSHLYDLRSGDVVQVTVGGRTQSYRVTAHQIVEPSDVAVISPTGDARLTIITCWPFDVDTKRWIVTAIKV